jgi:hypothetical protein
LSLQNNRRPCSEARKFAPPAHDGPSLVQLQKPCFNRIATCSAPGTLRSAVRYASISGRAFHPVKAPKGRENITMNRNNTLYFIVGALVIGLIVVGVYIYNDRNSGVRIQIGEQGISVDDR